MDTDKIRTIQMASSRVFTFSLRLLQVIVHIIGTHHIKYIIKTIKSWKCQYQRM
ncbi:hypothetical protein QE152_g21923, partial [Popillia japonica]